MPVFLQAVDVPERCFLGEVLLWVAFQRLPTSLYDDDGQDVRDTTEASGLIPEIPEWVITEDETKRADIPPDPEYLALMGERPTSPPAFYDDLLKRYDVEPEESSAHATDAVI